MNNEVKLSEEKTIVGRLGGDPEKKVNLQKHYEFVKFSVATKKDEETIWVDVVASDKLMEHALQFKKGELVTITGVEKSREDEKGKTHTSLFAYAMERKEKKLFKGNLTGDPQLNVRSGITVLELNIAINEEGKELPRFEKVSFFNDQATKYKEEALKKGDFISVVGYPNSRLVEGKDGGEDKVFNWVNGTDLKVLSRLKDRKPEMEHGLSK